MFEGISHLLEFVRIKFINVVESDVCLFVCFDTIDNLFTTYL